VNLIALKELKSFGLFQEDVNTRNKEENQGGNQLTHVHLENGYNNGTCMSVC